MAKAAYPTIGIAAFVMFVIVYFIGGLPMSRLVNYIFPSISDVYSGLSKYLLRAFEYTAPISYMHMSIKDTSFGIGGSDDEYVSSSFGAIEDALRKELGVERIREDLSILLCKAGGEKI